MSSLDLTKIRTGDARRRTAQVARGRYFVHELTLEVNLRVQRVAKIMAMPGTRTIVADLFVHFWVAPCM